LCSKNTHIEDKEQYPVKWYLVHAGKKIVGLEGLNPPTSSGALL